MSEDARFVDQAAIALAAALFSDECHNETLMRSAYDAAEVLGAERASRRPTEGVTLTGLELESLREALRRLDRDDEPGFDQYFEKAMKDREAAGVAVRLGLRKLRGNDAGIE